MDGKNIEEESTGFNRNPSIRDTNWCNRCMDRIIGGRVKVYVPCLHHMCLECVKECHKESPRNADAESDCPICQEKNTGDDYTDSLPQIEPTVALPLAKSSNPKKKSQRMFNQPTKFQTDVRLLNINSNYDSDPSVIYSGLVAENKDAISARKPENWIMMDDIDGALTNGSSPQIPVSEYNISWCGVCLEKLDGKRYTEAPLCGHIICHKCLKQHQKGTGRTKSNEACPQCEKENAENIHVPGDYHIPSALTTTSDVTKHATKSNSNESSLSSRTTQRSTSTVEEQNWTRSVATGLIKPNKVASEILRQKSASQENLVDDTDETMKTDEKDVTQEYMDYELLLLKGQKEPLATYADPSNSYKNSMRTMNPMYEPPEDDFASRSSISVATEETQVQFGKLLCQIPAVSEYERKYDKINPVNSLSDITFISDSELAVVDHSNKMVRLFYGITFHDSNGNAFQKWNPRLYTMRPNRANSQFMNPVRITNIPSSKSTIHPTLTHCAKATKIVVADESGKSIQFFDTNVSRVMDSIQLDYSPMGIAYSLILNRLMVLDKSNGKVNVYDVESQKLVSTIEQYQGGKMFENPNYVAYGSNGSIIVVEENQSSGIKILDHDGNFRSHVGREGKNPGEFSTPQGVCTDNLGNIYVADKDNDRIQKFDKDGGFLDVVLDSNDGIKNPMAICVNATNKMAVTQFQSDIICIYDIN